MMPAKKSTLTDEERAKRIQDAAREVGTNNDPDAFDRAFRKVMKGGKKAPEKPDSQKH